MPVSPQHQGSPPGGRLQYSSSVPWLVWTIWLCPSSQTCSSRCGHWCSLFWSVSRPVSHDPHSTTVYLNRTTAWVVLFFQLCLCVCVWDSMLQQPQLLPFTLHEEGQGWKHKHLDSINPSRLIPGYLCQVTQKQADANEMLTGVSSVQAVCESVSGRWLFVCL